MSSKIELVTEQYKTIQENACSILERADGEAKFSRDGWHKDIGYGLTRVITGGKYIEKAAVNFSRVKGKFTDRIAKIAGNYGETFAATGISSIIHPVNPHAPIIHMNIRYFETDGKKSWFGGGIDLTPHYINNKEAALFHKKVKEVCDITDSSFYETFKNWADDYFFIKHRNETRGIGGIFFDNLSPGNENHFNRLFEFTLHIGKLYPNLYRQLLDLKKDIPYTPEEKKWQLIRRSRYVEFNLVYDRGTKFGLESGGNAESILVSMPPEVVWEYQYKPVEGSSELETLNLLKKGINWLEF